MGANNSTRRVSFESDENDNITVVKGIRLSENVIKRMKEPAVPLKRHPTPASTPSTAPTVPPPPLLKETPPLHDPLPSFPPHPVDSVSPPPPTPSAPSVPESGAPPSLQRPTEQVAAPTVPDILFPASSPPPPVDSGHEPAFQPLATPSSHPQAAVDTVTLPTSVSPAPCPAPTVSEVIIPHSPPSLLSPSIPASAPTIKPIAPAQVIDPPVSQPEPSCSPPAFFDTKPITSPALLKSQPPSSLSEFEPVTVLPASIPAAGGSHPAEAFASPPLAEFAAPCEPVAPPPQLLAEPLSPAPDSKSVAPHDPSPVPPPAAAKPDEETLRRKIADELQEDLAQQKVKAEQEMQAWFNAEKIRLSTEAQAEAQTQFRDEVSKILSAERAAAKESLQETIIRERIAAEDEKLRAQLLAKQLEAKEADLKKQDAFYREQVARLEERSAQVYKVTTENYHKAADEVNAKYKRYEVNPVCADLQGEIMACYKNNVGRTLNCSNIAALYLQCVNSAKENKLKTGG